jgi:HSP20 family molecular chaperone IbpA
MMMTSTNPLVSSSSAWKPFDDTFDGKAQIGRKHTYQECTAMPIDLVERYDRYILIAEMPGFADIETYCMDGYFHLSGNKRDMHDNKVEDHHHLHLERGSGTVKKLLIGCNNYENRALVNLAFYLFE